MNIREPNKIYAVKHKNETVREASRSGGIFTALSDYVLSSGGIIYGCVLTENFIAAHIRALTPEQRDRMRGSKYIQSRMGDSFKNIKQDLEAGRYILFSGTSCQIAGLKGYLGKEYSNLLCVDVVCHGVPSPKVWQSYLMWQEKKSHSKIDTVDFRNKKDFGWKEHVESIYFKNGQITNSKIFTTLFYGHSILRPCCYECPYKSVIHPGDITIADYWGIENAAPKFDDNKGVSLVLINSKKGNEVFEAVKDQIIWQETKLEDSMQPSFKAPFPKPRNRNVFWDDFKKRDFGYIAKKYGGIGISSKMKSILIKVKRKMSR